MHSTCIAINNVNLVLQLKLKTNIDRSTIDLLQWSRIGESGRQLVKVDLDKVASGDPME